MRAALISREYPPDVYGGAGVHIEFLTRELRKLIEVEVHCFGAPRGEDGVHAYEVPHTLRTANAALGTLGVDVEMAAGMSAANLAHSHTWYANTAGHLASLLYDIPHVVTAHSLEPLRPWKAEQLGGGYRLSSWAERTAYEAAAAVIAVSDGMAADILAAYPSIDPSRVRIIPNGIDTELYRPVSGTDVLQRYGLSTDAPIVLFVGRITRQKGVAHLVAAARDFAPGTQIALCAGAPDTPELAAEITAAVTELQAGRDGVVWIQEMLPREELLQLLTAADVFLCPSIYEPQGIVNLEAMACQTAVVASRVGGIPDVVVEGQTGLLVDYAGEEPAAVAAFRHSFADAVNQLLADPARRRSMGVAGRERAVAVYGWTAIAERTVQLYRSLL
ncbi:glycogen synthase [Jatrophihabitans telluris]|uniref:Glycogen synthase n=1 Tax=Jatrophihabitans telluris TaxID=2038343 RepID=A0ABY4QW31_9ACTN|nr:glycogen synthase [Jatrophihabitans telluris]UQX87700.1 glycogen synthase [Jatrophihabitans telluris]